MELGTDSKWRRELKPEMEEAGAAERGEVVCPPRSASGERPPSANPLEDIVEIKEVHRMSGKALMPPETPLQQADEPASCRCIRPLKVVQPAVDSHEVVYDSLECHRVQPLDAA